MEKKNQLVKLYLDDIRNPKTEGWTVVRSYNEFVNFIKVNGIPDEVSFDHDLAFTDFDTSPTGEFQEKTGYDAAKWLCDYCWTNGLPVPKWNVHSANPVGRQNIEDLMKNMQKKLN